MHAIPTPHRAALSALFALALFAFATGAAAQAADAPAEPPATAADPGATCSASFEQAQTDKLAGHYLSAKAAALACSQIECNALIVRECVRLYDALERETPTLVVSARKAEGGELTDVRVEMDGKLIAEQISGRYFAVDPGLHEFVFIHPERGRVQLTATARVGDRARVVEATFEDPFAKKATPPPATKAAATPAPARSGRSIPTMTYVLGGIGIVGIGGFALMRVSAASEYNRYATTCAPACNPDEVDGLGSKFLASYISLGVGVAGLGGAALVYAFASDDGESKVQASIAPRLDGAMLRVKAKF